MVGTQVNFVEGMYFKTEKEVFLANTTNKQILIHMLSTKLQKKDIKTAHVAGDAYVLIATAAVNSASKCPTTLFGEDTDLLVLLCKRPNQTAFTLLFRSDGHQISKKMKRIWDINLVQRKLGLDKCKLLPVIHAFTDCDTSSQMYGIGKESAPRKVISDSDMKTMQMFS